MAGPMKNIIGLTLVAAFALAGCEKNRRIEEGRPEG